MLIKWLDTNFINLTHNLAQIPTPDVKATKSNKSH